MNTIVKRCVRIVMSAALVVGSIGLLPVVTRYPAAFANYSGACTGAVGVTVNVYGTVNCITTPGDVGDYCGMSLSVQQDRSEGTSSLIPVGVVDSNPNITAYGSDNGSIDVYTDSQGRCAVRLG